jgi:hypothetical protein
MAMTQISFLLKVVEGVKLDKVGKAFVFSKYYYLKYWPFDYFIYSVKIDTLLFFLREKSPGRQVVKKR